MRNITIFYTYIGGSNRRWVQFFSISCSFREKIPVGCVPPTAVAVCVCGGGCLPQCMLGYPLPPGVGLEHLPPGVNLEIPPRVWAWRPPRCGPGAPPPPGVSLETPPQVWAWRPPRCGPGDPPRPDPSTSLLGMGLETYKACWDTTPPPGDLLQGMLGYPPHEQNHRHV